MYPCLEAMVQLSARQKKTNKQTKKKQTNKQTKKTYNFHQISYL